MNLFIRTASALILVSAAGAASAQVGGRIVVAQTGDVMATFLGTSASFTDVLYLDSPTSTGPLFNNQTSAVGSTVDLGTFTAGTELIFRLHVNNTGNDFFTGDASRNPDGFAHARVDMSYSPTAGRVDFEDLYNGPFEYNDLSFSFTNIRSVPSTPGPLAALPFALMAVKRRRKARS